MCTCTVLLPYALRKISFEHLGIEMKYETGRLMSNIWQGGGHRLELSHRGFADRKHWVLIMTIRTLALGRSSKGFTSLVNSF